MRRPRHAAAALVLSAGLLASCATSDDGASDQPGVEVSDAATPDATSDEVVTDLAPDQPSMSPGDDASPDPFAADDGALNALSAAESRVEGGLAFELDREDDDGEEWWEVHVAANGVEHEIHVSLDGTTVLREESDDDLDSDDRARLDAASVSAAEAGFNALSEVTGTIEQIDLDEENGTVVWEVEIRTDDGADIDVYIDAVTGEVL